MLSTVGPGSVLGGRYALGARTRGGAADAGWRAYDQTLDRVVAMRVVPAGHPHIEAMLDAARRAASVEDPRLLRVLDVGRDASVAFVVSEWVDAPTLAARLRTGPLTPETVRAVVGEASLALENVRHRGLHHLALLPADVHLLDDGTIKIFGVAVHAALAGDDHFGAEDASARDTEGLVAIAYACLTGYWPLDTASGLPPAPRIGAVPAPPSEIVSGVPADLDALCAQAFAGAGAPASPGALADQIAPWGRTRHTVPGPHPLAVTEPITALDPPGTPDAGIDLRDGLPPTDRAPAGGVQPAPARTGPDRVRRVLTDEAGAAAGLAGPSATPDGGRPAGRALLARGAPALAAARTALARVTSSTAKATGSRAPADTASTSTTPMDTASTSTLPMDTASPSSASTNATTTEYAATKDAAAGAGAASQRAAAVRRPGARGRRFEGSRSGGGRDVPFSALTTDLFEHDPAQPAAPLLPPTPLSRPPRDQTRTVLLLMAAFVAVFLLLGYCGLRGLGSSGTSAPRRAPTAAPAATPTATPIATPIATPTPTPTPTAAATPLRVAAVTAFDPEGDGAEKNSLAGGAVDGDPDTAWESETYRSDTYGGLKDGVGLLLDLGSPTPVTRLTARLGGENASVELRSATGPTLAASTVLASADGVTGTVQLRAAAPVTTRYLVLWFTTPARVDGGYRAVVDELSVR